MEEMERFGLTKEKQMLQDMVRRLAKEEEATRRGRKRQDGEYP